ncbi:Mu transposase C-terminal domain-containing protein [Pseudonocardia sp. EC080625-04]|uniref:Mu transposase C-terminal domain-containing protein n=1 Tax=Pseudonocardia sp. EC080625-04 TaxID=1096868 RepID=UPI000AA85DDC
MTRAGLPILASGEEIRLEGRSYRVAALDGASVRLVDVTGTATVMLVGSLMADPSFELVTRQRPRPAEHATLELLPDEVRASALWWERHVVEVVTGVPPDAAPGTVPCPDYDPARHSLRQRELAKHAALAAAGHQVGLSTLKRLRRRYETDGLWGLVDQRHARAARGRAPGGRTDPRVVEATRRAIAEQTQRSTGTVDRLRRRVEQLLADDPQPPPMPAERTFYRLVARLSSGQHTFGSARTRRSLAKQPDGPFATVTVTRPGEWTQIDSTPLDVRVVLDDGTVDRVELTGLVDQATRTIAAAVLRPTTKAVDAALLLARAVTPEPMRPGWTDALRMTRSVLPHESLTSIDTRLAHAAARPVIVPETIVCDHGKAYLSATFRSACRSLGISLQPAHPDTPTDKPIIERTLGSIATLFAQYVAGYVGRSVEHRGHRAEQEAVWSMTELQALLDEWIVAVWQNRPHDGLRDPLTPGQALTPNERYAALVAVAGYVPVPLGHDDYIELLPVSWRAINSYGIKLGRRRYDSAALNPYRGQTSGVEAKNGRWEVHHDPYDISRLWVRNHHDEAPRFLEATWTHLRTTPVPFGEHIWAHAREILAARGRDPVTEAEIAEAAARLLDTAAYGPDRPELSGRPTTGSTRTRRIVGRTRATAGDRPARTPRPSLCPAP